MPGYKYTEKQLGKHRSHYVDPYDERDVPVKCYQEADVVNPIERATTDPDSWAGFVSTETMAVDPDGKVANLLSIGKPGTSLKVTGKVQVDDEFKGNLRKYRGKGFTNLNGALISLASPDSIAIGCKPTTLWVSSNAGWFEVRPHAEYRAVFERIEHVIGIYFQAVEKFEAIAHDLHVMGEDFKPVTVREDVHSVFERHMVANPIGSTIAELIQACKEARHFIIDQFRKKHETQFWVADNTKIKWTDCNFYRWVVAGCSENPPNTLPADSAMSKVRPPPAGTALVWISQTNTKSPTPPLTPPLLPHQPTQPPPQPAQSARLPAQYIMRDSWDDSTGKSYHGQYISPEFPQGILDSFGNVEIIAAVACHAVFCGRVTNLQLKALRDRVYVDFNIHQRHEPAHNIVHFYAKRVGELLSSKSEAWKKSQICKELAEAKFPHYKNLPKDQQDKVDKHTKDGKTLVHRNFLKAKRASPTMKPKKVRAAEGQSATSSASPAPASSSEQNLPVDVEQLSLDDVPAQARTSRKRSASTSLERTMPPEMMHRDPAKISGPDAAAPSHNDQENVRVDSVGKIIPQRIKRSKY